MPDEMFGYDRPWRQKRKDNDVVRRPVPKSGDSRKRQAICVDEETTYNKRSGVYVDRRTEVASCRTATVIEDDDERQPLLSNFDAVSRPIIEQTSRLDSQTKALLATAETISAARDGFPRIPQKKSFWRRCCCCCPSGIDDT